MPSSFPHYSPTTVNIENNVTIRVNQILWINNEIYFHFKFSVTIKQKQQQQQQNPAAISLKSNNKNI